MPVGATAENNGNKGCRVSAALTGSPFTPTVTQYAIDLCRGQHGWISGYTFSKPARLRADGFPVQGIRTATQKAVHLASRTFRHLERARVLLGKAASAGLTFQLERPLTDPLSALSAEVAHHDVTVVGARDGWSQGSLQTSDLSSYELLLRGVRPLLAVGRRYRPVQKVVVAIDQYDSSLTSLHTAVQLGLWPHALFQLVYFGRGQDAQQHLEAVSNYCLAHGLEVAGTTVDPQRTADRVLHQMYQHEGDVLVLGDQERGRCRRWFDADIARQVLAQTTRAVFIG